MHFAIDTPNFGDYADPRLLAQLAREAEGAGWDGFFLWDHIGAGWPYPVGDPWVQLAAMAMTTEQIKLGTTVTPLPRRRPWQLAREVVTLDHLSRGRVILGVGIGSDSAQEYSCCGESPDDRVHAAMLDEGLTILTGLWCGEPFSYQGVHYQLHQAQFLPPPERRDGWLSDLPAELALLVRYGYVMKLDEAALETLLSEVFGVPVHVSRFDRLTPWYVVRCHLEHASSSLPESVIVKGLRQDPNGSRTDPQQVLTEKAALEFLAELGVHITPRLLASDIGANILVLEDLAPRVPLAAILQSADSERAKVGLSAFARALGELSAATVGHEDTYYAKRRALGSVDPQAERERFMGNGWTETRGYAEALGVSPSGEVETEMAAVVAEIAHPGAFLSFSNGDAGSNNFLIENCDGRIIDFEVAGYRHALTDAVCLYVPGPMWLTVSDPSTTGLEAEYRAALCRTVPQVADNRRFGFGLAAACMAFAIERLNRFPVIDGRPAGDQSRLHRIATLESAAAVAESHGALRHLTSWARRLGEVLRRRWPDADVDLTAYDPYTPRR